MFCQDVIKTVLERYGRDRVSLLPCLKAIQETEGYISEESVTYLSSLYGIPAAEIYSVASFYGILATSPKGKYLIKVCSSLSCSVNQSQYLIHIIGILLNIRPGQTTPDNKFTLEVVDCLGLCDQAPVMLINDTVYGKLNDKQLKAILNDLRSKE